MSRWRDVKKGEVKKKQEVKKDNLNISPLVERSKAFITDTFLITMPIMYIVFYAIMGSREAFRDHMLQGWIYILLPHAIITTLFLYIKNQTPGYKAYSIKLRTKKLENPNFLQIVLRYIIFTISLFLVIPLFFVLFNKNRLGIHDIISSTIPIHVKE